MDINSNVNYLHDDAIHNTNASKEILPFILEILNPINSILDVGCGTGTWLKTALNLGIKDIQGLDGVAVSQEKLHISPENIQIHNLNHYIDLNRKFDLAVCLEVAEHLPESAAKNIVKILTSHTEIVIFSAAIPNQGGQHHLNEQWPVFWQKLFSENNFYCYDILRNKFWDNKNIEWWYKQNIVIYAKKGNSKLSFATPCNIVTSFIHPELFQLKLDEIERLSSLIKKHIHEPKIVNSIKILIRSFIK